VRSAHFRVVGRLDNASKITSGTVTIARGAGLFTVRPARRRRVYELPLSDVATMVVQRILRAEELQRRQERKAKAQRNRDRLRVVSR